MYVIGTAGHVDHGKSALVSSAPRTEVRGIELSAAEFSPRGLPSQ
jgi:translation elongation factor EF-Tu-like GTPase